MDVTGLIVIPIAATITAFWIIGTATFSGNRLGIRAPFLFSYGLGVIFMEPWRISAWQDLAMFAVMLVMLAIGIAAGCLVGALPALLVVSVCSRLWRSFGR